MVRPPITSAFRNAPPTLAPLSPLRRTAPSRCPSFSTFRSISASILLPRRSLPSRIPCRSFQQAIARLPSRPFSSSARNGFGNQQYNRFGGQRNRPLPEFILLRARTHHFVALGLLISGVYIFNLEEVEMTGRKRFNCVSHEAELKMGREAYEQILREERGRILPPNHRLTLLVKDILARLVPFAPIEDGKWEVHVIHDPNMVNAFVIPGGKVFVYTGIIPVCRSEDCLAAVLGHEISHVVARHPAERMSQSTVSVTMVWALSLLFDVSGHFSSFFMNLLYSLPNSRIQEAEADIMGLTMMARACYNPEAAVEFWSKMYSIEKQEVPQFMSTHPSNYNRMEALREGLPKAMSAYENSACHGLADYRNQFGKAYQKFSW